MERQFLDPIEGNKAVANYNDRFNALSYFTSMLFDIEEKRYRYFLKGLCPSIREL